MILQTLLFSLLAYLIGATPFSYLIAKACGVDLKRVGSGNVGATNVARSVGLPYGILALILDGAKGALAAYFALRWALPLWLCGFSVVGHNWSAFLGFKSGKGVATSLGILAVISWQAFLVTLLTWGAIAGITRYVSVASVSALLLSALWLALFRAPAQSVGLMALLGLMSAFQHRENFRRLARGEEHRLG